MPEGSTGLNIARRAALRAGLPAGTAGTTIDRQCASGLQAIAVVARAILHDGLTVGVAGGLESISLVQNDHRNRYRMDDAELLAMAPAIHMPMIDTAEIVAKRYGMLQPGESETAAVRAVFFIDPHGKIRLIMYYPLNVGRNMEEIKRVLIALQTADKYKVALPLNWTPGEKVIVPPPKTVSEMIEREASDYEMVDFYLAKKEIPTT
jgi:hypothetical protein